LAAALKIAAPHTSRSIVRDFSTRAVRGDRICIIGANGAGNTTPLNMRVGVILPDNGRVQRDTSPLR
jgi:ABC transport system ATP-binding/permease protein